MSSSRLDSFLSTLISSLFALLLFLLPLLLSMKSSEVFEFPKILFVYAMTILIVACWIARMIVSHRIIYARTPLDIPIYLFLLSQLLSTLFSIDLHTSIHGYYSRWNGGLLSTIAYTMLYLGYVSNRRQATSDKRGVARAGTPPSAWTEASREAVGRGAATRQDPMLISILASATIVSFYAILQRLGVDKDFWVQDVVSRVFSTQGQPNWLAGYLVMILPLSLAFILSSRSSVNRLIGYSVIWLFGLAITFTRSRSGLLGFVVADLTFWSVMVWNYMLHQRSSRQQPTLPVTKKKYRLPTIVYHLYSLRLVRDDRLIVSFLSIHALILVLVLLTNNPAREWIQKRLQSTDYRLRSSDSSSLPPTPYSLSPDSITPSSDIRLIVWTGALQLVKERPWFGWGPETFAFTYWKVRPIAHNMTSEWNFLYNKAHNEWLNLAANTGLFGLGTHLLLLGWFTVWGLRRLQATGYRLQASPNYQLVACRLLLVATISALWGAEIVNFFGFSTVTTQAYSYLFMAMAVTEGMRAKGQGPRETKNDLRIARNELRIPFTVYCLLFIVTLSALYLLSQISISFLADLSYNRGKQYAKNGYLPEALADLESAVVLIPDEPVFRSGLAETQGVLAVSLSLQDEEDAAASSLKDFSLMNFRIVGKQSPANVSFLRIRARVTYALGSLNPSLYDQGIELMERTMGLAPTDPKIPYNLGVMLQDRGRTDDAKGMFEKALELKPDYEEAKIALSPTN